MKDPNRACLVACAVAFALGLAGCAGWNGEMQLTAPSAPEPEQGIEMRLGAVRDERVFRRVSSDTWQPTLREGSLEQGSLTSRVVGRRGRPRGDQLGNLFTAPGQNVESLVGAAVTAAYRRAGYRVLESGAPDYEDALQIEVGIQQLWTRHKASFGPPLVEFRIRVRVAALPDFDRGVTISCASEASAAAATGALYRHVIDVGLERFADALRARLAREAPPARCQWSV